MIGTIHGAGSYVYHAYKTNERITLDGKPDEPVWSHVNSVMKLSLASGQGSNAVVTHADSISNIFCKAVWDSASVFFYVWVDEKTVWNQRKGRDTLGFWMENAVEIYLDDIGDNKNFMECDLAPNGSITDIFNAAKYSGTGNNTVLGYDIAGIATGVWVRGTLASTYSLAAPENTDKDSGFGMEIKIPFASLKQIGPSHIDIMGNNFHTPPHNNDSCRVNLFYTSCPPKAGIPDNNDRVNFAWDTDVGIDFHETSKFGSMFFIDSLLPTTRISRARFEENPSLPRKGRPLKVKASGSHLVLFSSPAEVAEPRCRVFSASGTCVKELAPISAR